LNRTITLELTDQEYQVLRECMNTACLTYIERSVDIDMLEHERKEYSEKYDVANSIRNKVYGYMIECAK
jgi:hypothetical protein